MKWLEAIHAPGEQPRSIMLTKLRVCIRKDKPGLCSPDWGDTWRQTTQEEQTYIEEFTKQL